MKKNIVLLIILMISISGCGPTGPETTSTGSGGFETLGEKVKFLEQYMNFDRNYYSLDYEIHYLNGGIFPPAPSEWDVKIVAIVPKDELSQWASGLQAVQPFDISWMKSIGTSINYSGLSKWYSKGSIKVAIDEERSVVIYRNLVI